MCIIGANTRVILGNFVVTLTDFFFVFCTCFIVYQFWITKYTKLCLLYFFALKCILKSWDFDFEGEPFKISKKLFGAKIHFHILDFLTKKSLNFRAKNKVWQTFECVRWKFSSKQMFVRFCNWEFEFSRPKDIFSRKCVKNLQFSRGNFFEYQENLS